MNRMRSGRAQEPEEQLEVELSPSGSSRLSPLLCPIAEDSLLHPGAEGRSRVVMALRCLAAAYFTTSAPSVAFGLNSSSVLPAGRHGVCVKLFFTVGFQPNQPIFFPTSVCLPGGLFGVMERSESEAVIFERWIEPLLSEGGIALLASGSDGDVLPKAGLLRPLLFFFSPPWS